MCRRAGWRRSWSELFEVGEPDLDQRPDGRFQAGLAGDLEGALVALPHLSRVDSLLQAIVTRHDEPLNLLTGLAALHIRTVTVQI
jgi:hypothetical protein